MQAEILDYKYRLDWDLDSLLTEFKTHNQIDPTWPLVSTTLSSYRTNDNKNVWSDFLNGRRRGKPSELRNSTVDSTFTYVADQLSLYGQILNVQSACAGSLYALHIAAMISLEQQTPVVVFCGDNLISDYWDWHFKSFGALDQESGRPFDSTSRGFRMGMGSAVFLIKHPSVRKPANPKAVIQSFNFYTNPELVANPGSAQDIVRNLSNIDYSKVELWNAHATGTPVGDRVEYEYFATTIKQDIPIVGFKGHVGHCLGACGAIEIAMAMDCKAQNKLLANNIQGQMIVADDRIITEPTSFAYKRMLKTSLGFGGKTAVVEIDLY